MKYKSLLRNVEYNSSVEDNRIVTVPNDYVNNDDDCKLIVFPESFTSFTSLIGYPLYIATTTNIGHFTDYK